MCGLLICLGSGALAAKPAARVNPSAPDVLVLVLGIMPSYDHVSINYSSKVPDQKVLADLAKVALETRWPISGVKTTTKALDIPGAQPTTQLVFHVPSAENSSEGTLPLSAFVNALKRYKVIEIDYVLRPEFVFRGRRDYEDRFVKVVMRWSGNSYNYTVRVKDSSFDTIRIPLIPDQPATAAPRPAPPTGARVLMILGIAIAGAAAVYLATAYYTRRRRV